MNDRAWAMRTSRDSTEARDFIRDELLSHGRLRQGWGSFDEQDLRAIAKKVASRQVLDADEQGAWGNRKFLGERSGPSDNVMEIGDLVLVPNMPDNGRSPSAFWKAPTNTRRPGKTTDTCGVRRCSRPAALRTQRTWWTEKFGPRSSAVPDFGGLAVSRASPNSTP